MNEDFEGFNYPSIDEKNCINCGICLTVCPAYNKSSCTSLKRTYSISANDINILNSSSSGGVFTLVANRILELKGVIFGAAYDDAFEVLHQSALTIEELEKLKKSKYVQSNIKNTFLEAENYLNNGRKVLFVGTPCQIAGLKLFLRKEYDNLLTIDFICSGVPSPKIFRDYIQNLRSKIGEIKNFDFRDKETGWENFSISVITSSNKKIVLEKNTDVFFSSFINKLILRPSCNQCKYIKGNNFSDLTIGDFWGYENFGLKENRGISIVVVNTRKGLEIIENLNKSSIIREHNYGKAIEKNWPLYKNIKFQRHRSKVFKNYSSSDVDYILKKNLKFSIFERVLLKMRIIRTHKDLNN